MLIGRSKSEIGERSRLIRADFARVDTAVLREELFNKQSGKCFWCTKNLGGRNSVESQLDHFNTVYAFAARNDLSDVEAVQQANAKTNFVLAHPSCNSTRNAIDSDEFVERIQSGEIVLGESKKWTPKEIETEKQRLSERSRKGGLKSGPINGRKNIESGHLIRIASMGGRIGGRKNVESGQIQALGRVSGRKAVENGMLASIRTPESCSKGGRGAVTSGHLASISAKGGRVSGRKNAESGQLASIATPESRAKGNHIRWHIRRGIKSSSCKLCISVVILMLCFPNVSQSQSVAEIQGGASNFLGNGGGFLLHGPNSETKVSAGVINGKFASSVSVHFEYRKWDVVLGDNMFGLTSGQMSLSAPIRGISAYRTWGKNDIHLFTGALGQAFSSPYFFGIEHTHIGAGISYKHSFGNNFTVGTIQTVGQKKTSLEDAEYKWGTHLRLHGQAGWLESNPQVSGDAAIAFRHLGFAANRSAYIFNVRCAGCPPITTSKVTTNSFSAYGSYGFFNAGASLFESSVNRGKSLNAGVHFGWLQVQASDYISGKQSNQLIAVMERGLHWTISEYLSHSNGTWSGNVGVGYTSNRFSVQVGYQELYFPLLRQPFQKVLSIQFSLRVKSASVNVGTVVQPNGRNQWTVGGDDYLQTKLRLPTIGTGENNAAHSLPQFGHGGKYVIQGQVVDTDGNPVEGACVLVGKDTVYTDSTGHFSIREKKKNPPIRVDVDNFMTPGTWEAVFVPGESAHLTVKRKS